MPELLDAILKLFPLEIYSVAPVSLMEVIPGDPVKTPIWEVYKNIIIKNELVANKVENVERFAFYERTKRVYAIVATSEKALYANIILKKGVVVE